MGKGKDWRERAKEKGNIKVGDFISTELYFNSQIAHRDWIAYVNPQWGIIEIEISLANDILAATENDDPQPNEMDVLSGLAAYHLVEPFISKLASITSDYKQLEIILQKSKRRIHLIVDVDANKRYVCGLPIFRHAEDN
jgi:hypothetical protein